MKVEIRTDHCHISGYVNAVERWSRPIREKGADGRMFSERIAAGAFRDALARNDRVKLMHNHQRTVDDVRSGRFQLTEDAIGLHFEGDVYDPEILERARAKELVGWSFGFYNRDKEDEPSEDGAVAFRRTVKRMDLDEVSIIDKRMLPAYSATSLEVRGGVDCPDEIQLRAECTDVEYEDAAPPAEDEPQGTPDEPDGNAPQDDGVASSPGEGGEGSTPSVGADGAASSPKGGALRSLKDYKRAILRKRLEIAEKC